MHKTLSDCYLCFITWKTTNYERNIINTKRTIRFCLRRLFQTCCALIVGELSSTCGQKYIYEYVFVSRPLLLYFNQSCNVSILTTLTTIQFRGNLFNGSWHVIWDKRTDEKHTDAARQIHAFLHIFISNSPEELNWNWLWCFIIRSYKCTKRGPL